MLTPSKKAKLLNSLKGYKKKYLDKNLSELDESGTRLLINHFLSEVLGYAPIEEIKTEYMIKGTYADYVIQIAGVRHFLVEVKALSLQLVDKHLRQTVNYGANEGIEWAMLTNGKVFEFHKILFNKPIDSRRVFAVDLSDASQYKQACEVLQYIHKDAVVKKSLKMLWNKCEALHHLNIAGIMYSKQGIEFLKKMIRSRYGEKCGDDEIVRSLNRVVSEKVDPAVIKPWKDGKAKKAKIGTLAPAETETLVALNEIEHIELPSADSLN
jgi:hypothetical protein